MRDAAFVASEVRRGLVEAWAPCLERSDAGLLARVVDELRHCDEHDGRTVERVRAAIYRALERLSRIAESTELSRRAPAELRDACGFTRVMISRARGTRWFPDTMGVADGADPEAVEFARFAGLDNEIPLATSLAETQMVRRRRPLMIEDARSDPRAYKPLVRVTRSPGYVAAPIVADDRVIGFLHADRAGQASALAAGDLESIALFAAEFGVLFEAVALRERLEQHRAAIEQTLSGAAARLDSLRRADLLLDGAAPAGRGTAGLGDAAPRRDALLTDREREILELIALGATNQAVAQELVVSPDTIKTHVSSILRKLRASSRAEAVARYLHMRAAGRDRGAT